MLHELKCNGISGNPLNVFENYQQNIYQWVYGTESTWKKLQYGVPQCSVLGPILFFVYINDLTDNISLQMRLFADESSLSTRWKGLIKLMRNSLTIGKPYSRELINRYRNLPGQWFGLL